MIRRIPACLLLLACACGGASVYSPPAQLVVVSDDNYPPYLFRDADGTLLMRDPEETVRTLQSLESYGVRIAVDDFGTAREIEKYL